MSNENIGACFYNNKRLDVNSWAVDILTPDVCTIRLRIYASNEPRYINIHNVYCQLPVVHSSRQLLESVKAVRRKIHERDKEEYVLLGDFNLHHPLWSGPSRPTQHQAADQLLDVVRAASMQLTLPSGSITWEARRSTSMIDLVFMTDSLRHSLLHCYTRQEMNQSSNHIPVSTKLTLEVELSVKRRKRAWKRADEENLAKSLRLPVVTEWPRTPQAIED